MDPPCICIRLEKDLKAVFHETSWWPLPATKKHPAGADDSGFRGAVRSILNAAGAATVVE